MAVNEAPSSSSSSASSTLLDQLRAGRSDAWERFVRLYGPTVYRWCRRSGLAADDAADVLQEVLAAVMRRLADFRRDRPGDSFNAWLATVTRNKVRDHYRRRQGRAEGQGGTTAQRQMAEIPQPPVGHVSNVPPDDDSIRPDAESNAWLTRRVLESIQAEFEPRTWNAFWQTTVDGRSAADVAQDLQMSLGAVYTAKSRVLRRLRQALGELPE